MQIILPTNLQALLEGLELNYIKEALNRTQNNSAEAAKLLGITRPTLFNRRRKYGLTLGVSNAKKAEITPGATFADESPPNEIETKENPT